MPFFFFSDDVGILEAFDPTGLIPQVAHTKPTQTQNRQIWGGFEYDVGSKPAPYATQLPVGVQLWPSCPEMTGCH